MAWTLDVSRTCDKFWFGVTTDKDLDCNGWISDCDAAFMVSEEGEVRCHLPHAPHACGSSPWGLRLGPYMTNAVQSGCSCRSKSDLSVRVETARCGGCAAAWLVPGPWAHWPCSPRPRGDPAARCALCCVAPVGAAATITRWRGRPSQQLVRGHRMCRPREGRPAARCRSQHALPPCRCRRARTTTTCRAACATGRRGPAWCSRTTARRGGCD